MCELCTPPLPVFRRAMSFHKQHGRSPVGGQKNRLKFLFLVRFDYLFGKKHSLAMLTDSWYGQISMVLVMS